MQESHTNSQRLLVSYVYSFGGMQVLSETLQMYTHNQSPSMVNTMRGLLFMIISESCQLLSSSTVYFLGRYIKEQKKEASDFNINAVTHIQ